ncbi:MAG TPA: hypothetical protein VIM30_01845 [Candidatus Limnocylindrales bacterium]|jgi:hypothetical protein
MTSLVPRDEREARIDLAGDRLAYLVVSYGLLLGVVYRSVVRGDAAWDLLGLVVLGGIVGAAYRVRQGAVSGRWTVMLLATAGIAIIVAGLLAIAGH